MNSEAEVALNKLVDAWESIGGGKQISNAVIERWLADTMKPAIDEARRVLGREIPK